MTSLAGNVLIGTTKKRANTINNLPTDIGIVWIDAITIELICLCSICSANSKYPAIPTKK